MSTSGDDLKPACSNCFCFADFIEGLRGGVQETEHTVREDHEDKELMQAVGKKHAEKTPREAKGRQRGQGGQ